MAQNFVPARAPAGTPVAHDENRFKLLYANSRPAIPADYCAPLAVTTTRQLIGARLRQANTGVEAVRPSVD